MSIFLKGAVNAQQTSAGRRFLGRAAAVLAVVIAAGIVVSVNQGNDGSATDVNAQINTRVAQADPENLPNELKRIYEMIAAAEANNDPRHIIERQMAYSSEFDVESAGSVLRGRFAHEFAAERATANGDYRNPMQGRAE